MSIQYEEYVRAQITLIGLLRKENVELRRKCEYMEIVENENAKLKEVIMNDSETGHQIAYLSPWEIRQRRVTDQIRPVIKQAIEDGVEIRMIQLERFEGEGWSDEAMAKLRGD